MTSRRIRDHVRNQWAGLIALFLVLASGTAYAVDGPLAGTNTVGSEDIINNDVKSADIADGRIFNVDIADGMLTGVKIKDGSVWGRDLDVSTDIYRRESTLGPGTLLPDGTFLAGHSCDTGDALLSGGPANVKGSSDIVESFPSASHTWSARIDKNGVSDDFNVVVRCLREG